MHPWAPRQLAVVKPKTTPPGRCLNQFPSELRTVVHGTLKDDIDIRLQYRKAGVGFRQILAWPKALPHRYIHPEMAVCGQTLPGNSLDVVPWYLDACVALLT